jgi:hypothetical protein
LSLFETVGKPKNKSFCHKCAFKIVEKNGEEKIKDFKSEDICICCCVSSSYGYMEVTSRQNNLLSIGHKSKNIGFAMSGHIINY